MRYSMLVVEDEADWRNLLSSLLDGADDIVVTCLAGTVREAESAIRRQPFDCAIIDLGLPDGSGVDLVAQMARAQPKADIAVCTVFEDEEKVLGAIRAGAGGYILKQEIATDLLRLIAQMRAGGAPISPRVARHILRNLAEEAAPAKEPGVQLTPRETEVLELIAGGMTLRKAAAKLGIAESTVRSHVKNLYGKLGVSRRSAAVLQATRRRLLE